PPQVSVVPGPRALLEGDRRALAATCTATGSSPRANVSWKTLVPGEQEERVWINANNTVTISNRYYLDPVRAMRGQTLDCIVTHSTFTKAARLQHRLDVYYVPEVSVSASENWHVGAEGAELECAENGNPPATSFAWMRLYGSLPNNSVTQRNRLQFKGSLTLQDAGIYVCDVTNKIGTRSAQLEVRVTDENSSSVNMLSMSFVAIGAVGLVLLIILVISVIAVNRYHRKKTEDMVYKL
ncbi:nectin-4-like, partial [Heptranchias perlo]|uniref:nectin-4-like n=1 Tax=Heptranchias perlo TaxID=212740 RepID=UPI003559F6CD